MPRYFTSATPVSKQVHTKVYSLSLQSLSADATKIEGSVALGAAVNFLTPEGTFLTPERT